MKEIENMRYRSLSIIIPNYNGGQLIEKFLPSVIRAAQNYSGEWEIIIVDDCSVDESAAVINRFVSTHEAISFYKQSVNRGFSATCNRGINHAKGEVLFFLNNDVALEEDFFGYFNHHFDDSELFGITVRAFAYGTDRQIDGIRRASWKRGHYRITENLFDDFIEMQRLQPPYPSMSVQGAFFFASAEKVRELGGFDELYSPFIFEDVDLAYRALKRGWKVIYERRCRAHHQVSVSIKKVSKAYKIKAISIRNRNIFIWKNIHDRSLILSHMFFLCIYLFSFRRTFYIGLSGALKRLPEIMRKRKEEKKVSLISDRELMKRFDEYYLLSSIKPLGYV